MYNDESYYLGNENMDFHVGKNFYPIKYSSNEKLSEVLRTTKSLIRNTDKYSSFIGKYKIQANPNLANSNDSNECFPILNSNGKSTSQENKQFSKTQEKREFISSQYFNPSISTKLNLKSTRNVFGICTYNSHSTNFNYNNNNLLLSHYNPNKRIRDRAFSKSLLPKINNNYYDLNNLKKISYVNILPELNVAFDIFLNREYQDLEYNINKIFYNDEEYFKIISSKIEQMKSLEKVEIDKKGSLTMKYFLKNNQMTLNLNSIAIEFNFPTYMYKEPIVLYLPICLLPLFYFREPEDIGYLFMALIEFKDNFEEIVFDFQKMYNFVIFSDKYETSKAKSIKYSRKKFPINVFHFKWYTPKVDYDVRIRVPEIVLLTEEGKKYCKYVDASLMLYLIGNSYSKWHFYCLNYIISDQDFRKTLNLLSSKESFLKKKSTSQFFLSEVDVSKPAYLKEQSSKFSLNDNKLCVLFTTEQKQNYINTLLPYKIFVNHSLIKKKHPFMFEFDFKQMIILSKIYLKWNLPKFFKKLININIPKRTIFLDKEYLEKIDDKFLNFTIKYDEFVELKNQKIELEILRPRIINETIQGTEVSRHEYNLEDKILKILIESEPENWEKVLLEHKCFMKDRAHRKDKLLTSMRKVKNVAGLLMNVRRYQRMNSGKNQHIRDQNLNVELENHQKQPSKVKSKRRSTLNPKIDYELLTRRLTRNLSIDKINFES